MKLVPCEENEATHVQVLPDEDNYYHCELMSVTPFAIYELLENDQPGYEGEEMIRTDDGSYACSFSLVVYVRWMRGDSD